MLKRAFKNTLVMLVVILIALSGMSETANALQPTKQTGTGTWKTTGGGYYSIIGYSMIFGGHTTSIALDDAGFIHESETTSPKYSGGFTVVTLSGNERRARGSRQVIMSNGSKKYLNYELRINPANFNRNSLVKGRSLLDNLYLESGVNKDDLDKKLATGGTAWINAIVSVRSTTQSHATMTAKRLWTNGKSNYNVPTRVYTRSDVVNAVPFSTQTKGILNSFFDNKFTFPQIDDLAPTLSSNTLTGAAYQSGSNYWVKPNATLTLTVRQHEAGSGNKYQYLRLMNGSTIMNRSVHYFSQGTTHKSNQVTHADVAITSAKRTENTKYGKVEWKIQPKKDGGNYATQVYFTDNLNNTRGYIGLDKNIRADGSAPSHNSGTLTGAQYVSGSNYWVKPNTPVTLTLRQYDGGSGNNRQYLRITGGTEVRASHGFANATTTMNTVSTIPTSATDIAINSVKRTEKSAYGKVEWNITPKVSGKTFTPTYHYTDNVGNANGYDTGSGGTNIAIKTDGVAPTVSFGTNGNSTYAKTHTTTVSVSDSLSGVKTRQYAWSTSNTTTPTSWTNFSNGATITSPTSTGTHYLWIKATDNVGNTTTTKSNGFKIDRTLPSVSASPTSGAWKNTPHTTTPSFSDSHSGIHTKQYAWSTSTTTPSSWSDYSSGALSQPGAGSYYLHVRATDKAGNVQTGRYGPFHYEKTVPTGTLTATPTTWTNGNVTLNLTAIADSGGSGYKSTKLPTGSYVTTTTASHTVTANGTYSFVIYDNAGNSTTKAFNVTTIDRTNPTVTFGTNGNGTYAKSHATKVTASDSQSGVKTTQYAWSTSNTTTPTAWTTFTNGTTLSTPTATGTHYLWVRATDHAGNTFTTKSNAFQVDTTVPTFGASPTSGDWKTSAHVVTPTYGDSHSGVSTKQYAWTTSTATPSSWSTYSSGTLTQPGAGTYYLHYNVVDGAGNSKSGHVGPYRYETTKPTGTLTQTPTAWTDGNVTLNLTSIADTGGSGYYRTKLPNGSYVTSTSATHTVISNGSYSFVIYDHAGNSTTKSLTVSNIDTANPTVSFSVNGNTTYAQSHSTKVTVSDSQSGVKTTQYAWSTSNTTTPTAWTTFTNGATLSTPTSTGSHYLWVKATDNVGHSITTKSNVFRVDVTIPTHVSSSITGQRYKDGSTYWVKPGDVLTATFRQQDTHSGNQQGYIRVTGNSQDVRYFHQFSGTTTNLYSVNSSFVNTSAIDVQSVNRTEHDTTNGYGTTQWKVKLNASGHQYSIQYYHRDNASNNNGYTTVGTAKVDGVAPTVNISPNTTAYTNQNVTLTITASDTLSGVKRIQKPDGTWVNGSSTTYVVTTNGTYTFVAEDNVGNSTTISHSVTNIDNTNPTATFGTNGNSTYAQAHSTSVTVNDASGIGSSQYAWSTSNTTTPSIWTNFTSGATLTTPESTGSHYLWLKVTDKAGNTITTKSNAFRVDRTPPTATTSPAPTTWTNGDVQLTVSNIADSGGSGFGKIKLPNGSYVTTTSATYTVTSNGTYTFVIYDKAGNATTKSIEVTKIDNTEPVIHVGKDGSTAFAKSHSTKISITEKGGSGVLESEYGWSKSDEKEPTKWVAFSSGATVTTPSISGNHYLWVNVTDKAENTTQLTTEPFQVDVIAPTASTSQTPTKRTGGKVTLQVLNIQDLGGSNYLETQLPDGRFVSDATISYDVSKNGDYEFVIYDRAGNKTVKKFTVANIITITDFIITPSTTEWTNQPVTLQVEGGSHIKSIMLPDGAIVNGNSTSYTVYESGLYQFVGLDEDGLVSTISGTFVSNIDLEGKDVQLIPGNEKWRNEDVDVQINILE